MARTARKAAQAKAIDLDSLTTEAVSFIRDHEPPEGYFVVLSGGKDSIVMLELVRMADVRHRSFYNVGIEPPEVARFIKQHYPETKFLYPKHSFFEVGEAQIPAPSNQALVLRLPEEASFETHSPQASDHGHEG